MQGNNIILVTVIIPCYNCEKLVGRAIRSVLEQTHPNIELLLIDNNSTDNTINVLRQYEREHPETIAVFSEKKKGACAARNNGLKRAQGQWIQFLDADDELLPQKIEKQLEIVMSLNPDVVIDDYRKVKDLNGRIITQNMVAEDDPWTGLINSRLGITSSNLWKKELLLKHEGWDEELTSSQEYNLLFKLLKFKAKVIITHQIQTIVYTQPDSVSRTTNNTKALELIMNRYNLRSRIYNFLFENKLLQPNYKRDISLYLYYHLLLISEFNMPYFKEQIRNNDFEEVSLLDKMRLFTDFLKNSSKRKFGRSNLIVKSIEFQFFFFKNISLLIN
ncbi:glycosyltransferase family 2 protein [Pontibacter sp. 172403-2]|uniref:glycosyltransferase family 2 protein n=1 Tax=Pontibacter rufus TaxID=2791028 RepID=UPI0018AF5E8E|nr:glycosyltransferase family 2 protein [Pontibacter sp. 172403-2]MBF9252536.1 glycosyltransferase family 2 protein [Pontibacter sp. 172403-2]